MSEEAISGAEIILRALRDLGVDTIFGYPGGAVLPIYDALFQQNDIKHILVRHEQGATHAAEGYARSTGKPGVVLVTSGPGATNTVTGITDAMLDSIPLVVLTGQVARHLIGNDAFQEADTVGITRPCTKHNYLVKDVNKLADILFEAFYVATNGRPGPVVVDLPKDVQIETTIYRKPKKVEHRSYRPRVKGDPQAIRDAVDLLATAKKPIIYSGGGVINAGPVACQLLTEFARMTGMPVTSTLMGLGAFPASDKQFLGMLGMHGTWESNQAMHDCDVMLAIGSRFDDRVTGRLDAFSPDSKKIHIDIDRSSINKNIEVEIPIVGDAGFVLEDIIRLWRSGANQLDETALASWWQEIDGWRDRKSLSYVNRDDAIMPQYAVERLFALTKDQNPVITTEVGQHQMWAAQLYGFDKPNCWLTSGGLGTMGYGLPAAVGAQVAHPGRLVIDISGDASFMMNMQEMATAVQYKLPIKVFIMNNEYLGMVRQWQELSYDQRYAESYSAALPDFVKLAEAFGATGLLVDKPQDLDGVIKEMLAVDGPVIVDCRVLKLANCFPMMPAGAAHNEMILGEAELPDKVDPNALAVV